MKGEDLRDLGDFNEFDDDLERFRKTLRDNVWNVDSTLIRHYASNKLDASIFIIICRSCEDQLAFKFIDYNINIRGLI